MAGVLHPKCGKRFPGGPRSGHCSGCCETFIGLASFEVHRVGKHGEDRRCEVTEEHWADARGYWHYGPRRTPEQIAEMFGTGDE